MSDPVVLRVPVVRRAPARRPRRRGLAGALAAVLTLGLMGCDAGEPEDPDPSGDGPTAPADEEDAAPDGADGEGPDEPGAAERPDLGVELTLTTVAEMTAPTAGAVGPDGTLYLAERAGTVHPLTEDGVGAPVVDRSGETTVDGERGLLGIAFAPAGDELYLSYTDTAGDSVLEAVAVGDDGEIHGDQRRTLLTHRQPYANHNGGDVRVGPDGHLYLGLGDGGGAGDPEDNGQDPETLLGALLRLEVDDDGEAVAPDDNPFVGDPDAADEVYAYGLRNPWRFAFDPETDELYIGDVGQDAREEIDVLALDEAAGANLGWNAMEGTTSFAGPEPDDHVPPVHEYETTQQRCAITGGEVYRGAAIEELVGAYLYSDFCSGSVWAIVVEDGEVVDEADLGIGGQAVVSFARDADGELYVLDFGGGVHRIDPA